MLLPTWVWAWRRCAVSAWRAGECMPAEDDATLGRTRLWKPARDYRVEQEKTPQNSQDT